MVEKRQVKKRRTLRILSSHCVSTTSLSSSRRDFDRHRLGKIPPGVRRPFLPGKGLAAQRPELGEIWLSFSYLTSVLERLGNILRIGQRFISTADDGNTHKYRMARISPAMVENISKRARLVAPPPSDLPGHLSGKDQRKDVTICLNRVMRLKSQNLFKYPDPVLTAGTVVDGDRTSTGRTGEQSGFQ